MFDGKFRTPIDRAIKPIGDGLRRTGLTPDHLTIVGLVVGAGAAFAIGAGELRIGLLLVILAALPDLLDGALARASGASSQRGAFFDSTVDRLTDALLLGGIAWHLASTESTHGREGVLAYATRDARDMGSDKLVLAQDAMPPDTHNTDLHFHSAREEAWFVRSGSGVARLGDDAHELRPGSFWLRRENTGVGHRIEVGPQGMELVTMGDLVPGDVVVYPEKRTFKPARGIELPY